jgi:hypothetical protein
VVLDHLQRAGGVELRTQTGERGDGLVSVAIGLEQLESCGGVLGAAAPSRPVEGERGDLLLLRTALDHGSDAHRPTLARSS